MLEARNLTKTYRTKKGAETKALDGVSVTFAEKGMVFILGKSGSGKSTLLNICGGLDRMDGGEILIKGRSSAEKGEFDFDSYRNTFVGFVFQEYNILEEFTVEENVALALELQHRKRDPEVISEILRDVEMEEFAKRKPNTLSGGQKQRVAIARALVKNPEIIMADEPTGALDSNTGKQVFDTLKRLSEDKLVLVVSHDREFAEQYGDRIIELKDGKIISDMTRSETEENAGKNVRFAGTDTVYVESGALLSDEDFDNIKEFLGKSKGSAVITSSRERVDAIARDLRGGEFGETGSQPSVREYSADEKQMIRSRLPARHAIKMGAGSLRSKPVRLLFTILLSVIAFTLFGVFSTMLLYDKTEVAVSSLCDSDYDYIRLSKAYHYTTETYSDGELQYAEEYIGETKYTYAEYEDFKKNHKDAVAFVAKVEGIQGLSLSDNQSQFYTSGIGGYVLLGDEAETLAGSLSLADGEIAISDYLFNCLKVGEYKEEGETQCTLNGYESVIGKSLTLENVTYTVKGVYQGEKTPEAFQELEAAARENRRSADNDNDWKWNGERESGLYACVAVNRDTFLKFQSVQSDGGGLDIYDVFVYNGNQVSFVYTWSNDLNSGHATVGEYGSMSRIAKYASSSGVSLYGRDGKKLSSLPEDGIGISNRNYARFISDYLGNCVEASEADGIDGEWNGDEGLRSAIDRLYGISDTEEAAVILGRIDAFMAKYGISYPAVTAESSADNSERTVTVAGVFITSYGGDCYFAGDALYDELYVPERNSWYSVTVTKYVAPEDAFIFRIMLPYDKSESFTREMVSLTETRAADDSTVLIVNPLMEEIRLVNRTVDGMSGPFLWIGLVLAAFSFLLMFNFISASITAKKKEIGILRAIGSRKTDVFKIFLAEALIIAAVCFALATAASFGVCALLNWMLTDGAGLLSTNLLVFGPLSVLCIFAIALVTAVVATMIPVAIYSRKAPVESIRAL